jgi:hypothetical protein
MKICAAPAQLLSPRAFPVRAAVAEPERLESAPLDGVEWSAGRPLGIDPVTAMIRRSCGAQSIQAVQEALRHFPMEALQRIADYGTRIEIFDLSRDDLPLYAHNLSKPNVAGCYSPRANVLCIPSHNISPLVLLHEMAHALDLSLGEVSAGAEWQQAHAQACATRQLVRPYASKNVGEYFAENVAAHLIPDSQLKGMLLAALPNAGVEPAAFVKNHQNYSRGRLALADRLGSERAEQLFRNLAEQPPPRVRPALDEDQYRAEMQQLLAARKASPVAQNNPSLLQMH